MSVAATQTVLIMAGGTGGHVFPALTIAEELRARGKHVEWLGTAVGVEARVVSSAGIPLHCIQVAGLRGRGALRLLAAPFTLLRSLFQALRLLRRLQPCCVLGMGGYVSGPGGLAAWLAGRTLLIHEQNAVAGLANRLLFPLAAVVMEAFPGAFGRAAAKLRRIGNPVRAGLLAIPGPEQRLAGRQQPATLLVVGGSLGAQIFNETLPAALALLPLALRPSVRHQCGRGKLQATLDAYRAAGLAVGAGIEISEFIDDMAAAYADADLLLCRAGASTLAEVTAIGLAAVLVPYPYATDDHQTANALALAKVGAAVLLPQPQLTPSSLSTVLADLLAEPQRRLQLACTAHAHGARDAALRAADLCEEACHG